MGSETFWREYDAAQDKLYDWCVYAMAAADTLTGWTRAYRDRMRRLYTVTSA